MRRQDTFATKALSEDQLARVLQLVPATYRELLEFLAETGLRIGEASELRWSDIDFGGRRIQVQRAVARGVVGPPKSRFGIRLVPMTMERAARLRERSGAPEELVFTNRCGDRIDPSNLQNRVMRPAAIKAGVAWASIHSLRHTCASRLFRAGWNAKQVQMMLGHHSPVFTLATYVHLMPDDLPMPVAAPTAVRLVVSA